LVAPYFKRPWRRADGWLGCFRLREREIREAIKGSAAVLV